MSTHLPTNSTDSSTQNASKIAQLKEAAQKVLEKMQGLKKRADALFSTANTEVDTSHAEDIRKEIEKLPQD